MSELQRLAAEYRKAWLWWQKCRQAAASRPCLEAEDTMLEAVMAMRGTEERLMACARKGP